MPTHLLACAAASISAPSARPRIVSRHRPVAASPFAMPYSATHWPDHGRASHWASQQEFCTHFRSRQHVTVPLYHAGMRSAYFRVHSKKVTLAGGTLRQAGCAYSSSTPLRCVPADYVSPLFTIMAFVTLLLLL